MTATAHTAELSARTATRLLAEAGLTGVQVNLPASLFGLKRLVGRTVGGTRAMQINANLTALVEANVQWMRDMGMDVQPLRVPDVMNTAAAAAAVANALGDDKAGPVGSRSRGLVIGAAKVQLDRLICHADSRHGHAAGWASEGFWLLAQHEPARLDKLVQSLRNDRLDDVLEALIEYTAQRKRAAARAALDVPTGGPDLAEATTGGSYTTDGYGSCTDPDCMCD